MLCFVSTLQCELRVGVPRPPVSVRVSALLDVLNDTHTRVTQYILYGRLSVEPLMLFWFMVGLQRCSRLIYATRAVALMYVQPCVRVCAFRNKRRKLAACGNDMRSSFRCYRMLWNLGNRYFFLPWRGPRPRVHASVKLITFTTALSTVETYIYVKFQVACPQRGV